MKDMLEVIAKALVDNPEQVKISEFESEDSLRLELRVAPEDIGKVIGRQGRIARAVRTLVKANAVRAGKKVFIDIVD